MSKSNKEKNRLKLIKELRMSELEYIPASSLKLNIRYISDEYMDYQAVKKKYIDGPTKSLWQIRENFNYIVSKIKPIINEYKYLITSNIAKELNLFEFNLSIWVSEEGISENGVPLYSLAFYMNGQEGSRPVKSYDNRYGKIHFLTNDNMKDLAAYSLIFDHYIFEIDRVEEGLQTLISNNAERVFFAVSETSSIEENNKNNNIDRFENHFYNFFLSLKNEFNYELYDNDLYFLRREYYIGNSTYWSITPERQSDYSKPNYITPISNFRKLSENTNHDYIKAMLEAKILNIHSENPDEMSIKDILDISSMFEY